MRMNFVRLRVMVALMMVAFLVLGQTSVGAADMKVEVQLLWGTNDPKSPNPNHTPVEADIKKRLKDLPLRWTNYFLVKKMVVDVPSNGKPARQPVSEKCA